MKFHIIRVFTATILLIGTLIPNQLAFANNQITYELFATGDESGSLRSAIVKSSNSGLVKSAIDIAVGVDVAVTNNSGHLLDKDGQVWGWGKDGREVGIGSEFEVGSPVRIVIPQKVLQIESGDNHTLALTEDGIVYAWGWNGHGQLGLGGIEDYSTSWQHSRPTVVNIPGSRKVVYVEAGGFQSFAIASDNTLWAWGINDSFNPLGIGGYSSQYLPTQIRLPAGLIPKKIVSDGRNYSLLLAADGTVLGWGDNSSGGLGQINFAPSPILVFDSSYGMIDIAVNGAATYFLNKSGAVFASGYNGYGQLGNTRTFSNSYAFLRVDLPQGFIADRIFASNSNAWATSLDGRTYGWGAATNDRLGTGLSGTTYRPVELISLRGKFVEEVDSTYRLSLIVSSNRSEIYLQTLARLEAEAKAAAELKAKQEAEAKAAAELKAKQEAEAKAAAELKAKQEAEAVVKAKANTKRSITCVKGNSSLKVIGKKPKCPAGFKKK